ncbi:hypothetical protein [Streptomyces sp. NPDC005303]
MSAAETVPGSARELRSTTTSAAFADDRARACAGVNSRTSSSTCTS